MVKREDGTVEVSAPTQVFLRWRPMIGEELNSSENEMTRNESLEEGKYGLTILPMKKEESETVEEEKQEPDAMTPRTEKRMKFTARMNKRREKQVGSSSGRFVAAPCFAGIVESGDNNASAHKKIFHETVLPQIKKGGKAGVFCYGHTGSGKTHTIFGYKEEEGICFHAAKELGVWFETLGIENEEDKPIFGIRFCELYNKGFFDLMNDRAECCVREGLGGEIQFRTMKNAKIGSDGGIEKKICKNSEEVKAVFESALQYRQTGNSSVHDQSSRSHAFLEFEITSLKLHGFEKSIEDLKHLAFVRYMWEQDRNHFDKTLGEDFPVSEEKFFQLAKKIDKLIAERNEYVAHAQANVCSAIGAEFILVDLAGNEHGCDIQVQQTKEEKRQGIEINKSLWELNNVLRARQQGARINWRNSSLTLALRKYLQDPLRSCVMVANLSPCASRRKATVRTIQFAQTVATASES